MKKQQMTQADKKWLLKRKLYRLSFFLFLVFGWLIFFMVWFNPRLIVFVIWGLLIFAAIYILIHILLFFKKFLWK